MTANLGPMDWPDMTNSMTAPEWAEPKIVYDPDHPERSIPLTWAMALLRKYYKANPAAFGNKLSDVVKEWATGAYDDEPGR
jgi:hypothetical protein